MQVAEVLIEAFGRIHGAVARVLDGLDDEALGVRLDPDTNSIAWLVWHLTRVQDHHISELMSVEQRYLADGWHEHFGRGPDDQDHGYGHTAADVASVHGTADELIGYYDAVHARTVEYLSGLGPADLDQVIDERWDPPVTLGVRLASLISDCLQHVGQAAFVRGLLT